MKKETKDILLRLLQQHKELGISEQIDYQKFYLSVILALTPLLPSATCANLLSLAIWKHTEAIRTEPIAIKSYS